MLKVIKALDERFVTDYVVNVVMGKLTPQINIYRHDALPVFGIGNGREPHLLEQPGKTDAAGEPDQKRY
jgi:ATP-dependent DNA helicase RecQ